VLFCTGFLSFRQSSKRSLISNDIRKEYFDGRCGSIEDHAEMMGGCIAITPLTELACR
jgi:hypothetical protein